MSNITITNNDLGSVIIHGETFDDDVFTAGAAKTYPAGTILARDSSTLKLVPFVKGGVTNENGVPKAVLGYDVVAEGAGDIPVRPMLEGKVDATRLIIDADGDASNVDAAVLDGLRAYSITAINVDELSLLDNQ